MGETGGEFAEHALLAAYVLALDHLRDDKRLHDLAVYHHAKGGMGIVSGRRILFRITLGGTRKMLVELWPAGSTEIWLR